MKTLTLYSFNELSDKAQRKAVNLAKLDNLFVPNWESDRHDSVISFLAIVKELDFELSNNGGISHHKYISDDVAGSKLKAMIRQNYENFFPAKGCGQEISGYWSEPIILNPIVEFLRGYPGYRGYTMGKLIRDINAAYNKLIDELWNYYTDHGVEQLLRESDEHWFTEEGRLVKF